MIMTALELENLTPYRDINTLLREWVDGVKRLLGDKVIGLYLAGSLSYGDFVPDRSDIDLQAVVRSPLTQAELKSVEQLHREVEGRSPLWQKRVECSYVPMELMCERMPPKKPRPWWGFGTFYTAADAGNEWTISQYLLSKHGIALEGPDFRQLIPPLGLEEVRQASVRDLFKEWVPKINHSSWLSNSHHLSYLVLNLCRILYTAIAGGPGSKKVAGQWAKEVYPEWRDLIEEAERWKYGVEMKREEDVVAFIRFAVQRVNQPNS
jgi:hypothetical protein